jgi:flagellar protein FlaI
MFDRGWSRAVLNDELEKRRVVLAYLIDRGLNSYAQVAATFMAFINDPETVLALMANDQLERSLEDLREMESVLINVEPGKEEMVPRPEPDEAGKKEVEQILAEAEDLFAEYRGKMPDSVAEALINLTPDPDIEASPDDSHEMLEQTAREAEARYPEPIGPARPDTAPADDGVAAYGTAGDVGIDADDLAVRADDLIATTNDVTAGADDVVVRVADLAANGSDRSVTADAVQHPGGSQDRAAPDDGADSPTSTRDDPVEPAAVDPALSNPEPVRPPDAGGNGSVASGSDADADSGSSTIDFDDPFDEGINVMEADAEAQETAASSLEKDGFDSSTGTDRAVDDAVEAATTDDAVEAATTDDATTALTDVDERGIEAEDPDAGDVEDNADAADRTGDAAIADEDVAAATEHGGTDDEDSDGNDDEDGDDEDGDDDADEADIDSWGFGTVEPPEEEG